jgi:hypothetical protein
MLIYTTCLGEAAGVKYYNMLYTIKQITRSVEDTSSWNAPPWRGVPAEVLRHHMGEKPEHFPKTEVKMAYDDTSVFVMFRVEDRYVRAVTERHQQSVCKDSCVEFFFTPGPEIDRGYFNLEMNCGGTILFHFHPGAERGNFIELPEALCNRIQCSHSLPQFVAPEITEPVIWTVVSRIPLDILDVYLRPVAPAPGAVWRGNFHKCADATSHPHWLTWAPVDAPKPDFHLPRFFGTLEFEEMGTIQVA